MSPTDKPASAVSIIIPVLNEVEVINTALAQLLRATEGTRVEIIFVDGGSTDGTLLLLEQHGFTLVNANRGRATQMNAGAAVANGEYLIFLHIDTFLPDNFATVVDSWLVSEPDWGFFRLQLSNRRGLLWLVEQGINRRSYLTGTATGDQVFFCRRELFNRLGGFPDIALMEDVALSRALVKVAPPKIESSPVITSSRRWEAKGVCRTVLFMWLLRLAYYCGVSPHKLAARYYPSKPIDTGK